MASPKIVSVYLLQHYGLCNAGEIAGYPEDEARALIDSGAARPLKGRAPAPKPLPQEVDDGLEVPGLDDVDPEARDDPDRQPTIPPPAAPPDPFAALRDVDGIDDRHLQGLVEAGIEDLQALAASSKSTLVAIKGIGERTAERLLEAAEEAITRPAEGE